MVAGASQWPGRARIGRNRRTKCTAERSPKRRIRTRRVGETSRVQRLSIRIVRRTWTRTSQRLQVCCKVTLNVPHSRQTLIILKSPVRNHSRQHARDRAVRGRARVPVMCPRRPASHAGGPRGRLARKQVQRTPFATHRTVHHPHGRAILVLTNHACHHARSQCHMLKGPSVSRVVLRGCCRAHRSSAVLYT